MPGERGSGRVFQRGRIWWIAYMADGKERRESARTTNKTEARKLLNKRLGEVASGKWHRDRVPQPVIMRYLNQVEVLYDNEGKLNRSNRGHLEHCRAVFGHVHVEQITGALIAGYIQERLGQGYQPGAINRELVPLSRAFGIAFDEGVLLRRPRIPRLPEHNVRQGFFTSEEIEAICAELPSYLVDVTRFAALTGWRRGEIVSLRWESVYRDAREIRLQAQNAKTRRSRFLAIEGELWSIIERRWRARVQAGAIIPLVFHREGNQIGNFRATWRRACDRAGVGGKTFHDLRRTAVRNMVLAGVPEAVIMSITGHLTRSMFDRYMIVKSEDQRRVFGLVFGQSSGQCGVSC